MLIAKWMDQLTRQHKMFEDLKNKIAARCESDVWSRIHPLAMSMDASQARGYVRARSSMVIRAELQDSAKMLQSLSIQQQSQIRDAVSDELVRRTMSTLVSHQLLVDMPVRKAA